MTQLKEPTILVIFGGSILPTDWKAITYFLFRGNVSDSPGAAPILPIWSYRGLAT